MTGSHDLDTVWREERPRLLGLATTMLRSPSLAEDVVQEAFARLSTRQQADPSAGLEVVENPAAWLTVVTANLCLDVLKSASHRRELLGRDESGIPPVAATGPDPADQITLDEQVREAMLVVLDRLSPAERVSFVLHDVFGLGFAEIAVVVGRSESTTRQLAHRARRRLGTGSVPPSASASLASDGRTRAAVERFVAACRGGSLDELIQALHPDAWGVAYSCTGQLLKSNRGSQAVAADLSRYLTPPSILVTVGSTVFAYRGLQRLARVELQVVGDVVRSLTATADPTVDRPSARTT